MIISHGAHMHMIANSTSTSTAAMTIIITRTAWDECHDGDDNEQQPLTNFGHYLLLMDDRNYCCCCRGYQEIVHNTHNVPQKVVYTGQR
jgi:hypothetical protein